MIRSLPNILLSAAIVMDVAFTLHTRFMRVSLNIFNFSCLIGLKKRDMRFHQSLISQIFLIPASPFHMHSEDHSGYLLVLLNLSKYWQVIHCMKKGYPTFNTFIIIVYVWLPEVFWKSICFLSRQHAFKIGVPFRNYMTCNHPYLYSSNRCAISLHDPSVRDLLPVQCTGLMVPC